MDDKIKKLIDDSKECVLRDEYVGREVLFSLLSINPLSEENEYLRLAGREIARVKAKNEGRVGSAFGMDLSPCKMNCKFCSLGEKWHLFDESYEFSFDDVIGEMKRIVKMGFYQFTIRTTEFYSVDKLCELGKKIRAEVPGRFYIGLNIGEVNVEEATRLYEAGFNSAYHSWRLGEGRDTEFNPEVRKATMRAISQSPLSLTTGLDPIGIEHTDEEIVDRIEFFRELNASTVCVMKRITVPGTPMEGTPEVSDERIAQITAVVRMASGGKWKNVAASPPMQLALRSGANTFGINTGANPRNTKQQFGKWMKFDHAGAVKFLSDAGYEFSNPSAYINSALNDGKNKKNVPEGT